MKSKIALVIIVVFMFNGLKDSRELNDLSILSAIGIDINENGEYIVTTQVLNTQKADNSSGSSSGGTSVVVYETTKKSIHEALRDTIEKVPNKLYIAHLELLLISEEAAKLDILDTIDFFLRDNEGGNNFMIAIAKDNTPQEVLSKLSAITSDPAKAISESIEATYEYEGASTDYLLYDSLSMMLSDKRGIVVASISLDKHENESKTSSSKESTNQESSSEESNKSSESEESSNGGSSSSEASSNNFKVTELAYFKDRKFEGYLEKNDSIVYNLLQNRLNSTVLSIDNNDELLVLELTKSEVSLKPRFEDDHFIIDINIKMKANVTETGKNTRENMNTDYEKYKQKVSDIIKGKVEDAIDNYQNKYEVDVAGFENLIYKKLNSKYKEVKDEFKEKYFKNIEVNVSVDLNLPLEGGDMVDGRNS